MLQQKCMACTDSKDLMKGMLWCGGLPTPPSCALPDLICSLERDPRQTCPYFLGTPSRLLWVERFHCQKSVWIYLELRNFTGCPTHWRRLNRCYQQYISTPGANVTKVHKLSWQLDIFSQQTGLQNQLSESLKKQGEGRIEREAQIWSLPTNCSGFYTTGNVMCIMNSYN